MGSFQVNLWFTPTSLPVSSTAFRRPARFESSVKLEKLRPPRALPLLSFFISQISQAQAGQVRRWVVAWVVAVVGRLNSCRFLDLDRTGSRPPLHGHPRARLRGDTSDASLSPYRGGARHELPSPRPRRQSRRTPDRGGPANGPQESCEISVFRKSTSSTFHPILGPGGSPHLQPFPRHVTAAHLNHKNSQELQLYWQKER